jgi:hypothetical protein
MSGHQIIICYDVIVMRTTLTIDDDLAVLLQKKAVIQGHSFKEVVNDVIRAGIASSSDVMPQRKPVIIVTRPLGLKPGYDPNKLNQLVDELETEEFSKKQML